MRVLLLETCRILGVNALIRCSTRLLLAHVVAFASIRFGGDAVTGTHSDLIGR